MLLNFAYKDIADCHVRIRYLKGRVQSLKRLGIGTEFAEAELADAQEVLTHLEHHRKIFEFSLKDGGGVRYGFY